MESLFWQKDILSNDIAIKYNFIFLYFYKYNNIEHLNLYLLGNNNVLEFYCICNKIFYHLYSFMIIRIL